VSHRVDVELETYSANQQLQLLFTGLSMLAKQGAIRLSQTTLHTDEVRKWNSVCRLRVGGRTIVVDMRDIHELFPNVLDECDACSKRSYQIGGYPGTDKVFPFGLNFALYPPGPDLSMLARRGLRRASSPLSTFVRAFALDRLIGRPATPRVSRDRPEPARLDPDVPAVVFFARTWDPAEVEPAGARDRQAVNDHRAACIRALRRALGPRFLGGLRPDRYAAEHYPDCLAPTRHTDKHRYLRIAPRIPIGVATTGLAGSIGWKFGEYVRFARAIVTDPLQSEVPGPFADGANYVSFRTIDECVEACVALIEQPDRVARMSEANAGYFDEYVRPDRAVSRVLGLLKRV
jgi:hypothetical protein